MADFKRTQKLSGIEVIREVFKKDVARMIKGTKVSWNPSTSKSAYQVIQNNDDNVLKSQRETVKI